MCIVYGNIPKSGSSTIRIWLKTLGTNVAYKHVANLTQSDMKTWKRPGYQSVAQLRECFFFTFIRDPVDRYVSGLYESHRFHPEEVNVTALTYAFAAASNDDLTWKSIDHAQNSIFNIGQLDYLRSSEIITPLSKSIWDFVGRFVFAHACVPPGAPMHIIIYLIILNFFKLSVSIIII